MERIRLTNEEFEGENSSYLFDGERTVLVDTGVATPAVEEELRSELDRLGVSVADLDAIVLTHWHADHAGLAGAFQRESGASVHVHAADAPIVEGNEAWREYGETLRERFAEWGIPDEKRNEPLRLIESDVFGERPTVERFEDGDYLRFKDLTFRILHTPGHTAGSCCLVIDGTETILSGDALLPRYTPNIGGADVRVEDPLGTYLDTLARIEDAGFKRAHPGHRDPIDDPAGRAREIAAHHRERTGRVLSALAETEPATAWEVSAELFGSLSGIHVMHGPGEAFAHLDHLVRHGAVENTDDGYVLGDDPEAALEDSPVS